MSRFLGQFTGGVSEALANSIQSAVGSDYVVSYNASAYSIDIYISSSGVGVRLKNNSGEYAPMYVFPYNNGTIGSDYVQIGNSTASTSCWWNFIETDKGLMLAISSGSSSNMAEIVFNKSTNCAAARAYISLAPTGSYNFYLMTISPNSINKTQYYTTASICIAINPNIVLTQLIAGTTETGIYLVNSGFTSFGSVSNGSKYVFCGIVLGIDEK